MPRRNIARQRRADCTSKITLESTNRKKKLAGTSRYRNAVFGLLMASITAFSAGHAIGAPDPQEAFTPAAHDRVAPGSIPEALQGGAWQQISSQIEADRHRIREHNGNWRAHTPGQRYSTTFGPDGPNLEVQDGERHHTVGFRFRSAMVDGQPVATQSPEQLAEANRMSYQRGGLTEWYVNRPEGLEQGFTIDEAPDGEALHIEMAVDSDLTPVLADNTLLLSDNGRIVFRYSDLKAWDATGRPLAAQMALNRSRLTLDVDIEGARFPITVDPVVFNDAVKLTAEVASAGYGGVGDRAGRSVSLDGDRVLIGAPGSADDGLFENGEAFIFQLNPGNGDWQFVARLAPHDPGNNDRFGHTVSLSDNHALIGAHQDDDNGEDSGSAYLFNFDGTAWHESVKLVPTDGSSGDQFGWSVALAGDRALVGAHRDDDDGEDSGSAYVFDYNGTTWSQSTKLLPDYGSAGRSFGYAVGLSSDRALVGAPTGSRAGAAYVFDFNGSIWKQTATLIGGLPSKFGFAVSLEDDRALVGAPFNSIWGSSGAARVFDFDGTNWNLTVELLPDGESVLKTFGSSVSLSGNRVVIGAHSDGDNGSQSGSAFVFEFTETAWNQTAKLLPNDGATEDQFGRAVSLSGDRALVGAELDDDNGWDSGSAYLFDTTGTAWNQTAKLLPDAAVTSELLGVSVSLFDNRALVGAPFNNDNAVRAGTAYVFEYDGNAWSQTAKLLPQDGAEFDYFGWSVSLFGSRALIGAYGDDAEGSNFGSAYVFDFNGTEWSQTVKLLPNDGAEGDRFGLSVSLYDDRALIGAYLDDDRGDNSGSAYVFDFNGTNWSQSGKLLADDGAEGDYFGYSVSLADDRALIGAYLGDDKGDDSGAAYVFDFSGTAWGQSRKLLSDDGAEGDRFGRAVSLSGARALIGADGNDDSGSDSGSAYVFDFDGTRWSQAAKLLAHDGAASDAFGHAVSLVGNRALVGAYLDDDNGGNSGSAYVFDFTDALWSQSDKLLPANGAAGDLFGHSLSLFGDRILVGAERDDDKGTNAGAVYLFSNSLLFSDRFED